eukprot:gene390-biopygen10622
MGIFWLGWRGHGGRGAGMSCDPQGCITRMGCWIHRACSRLEDTATSSASKQSTGRSARQMLFRGILQGLQRNLHSFLDNRGNDSASVRQCRPALALVPLDMGHPRSLLCGIPNATLGFAGTAACSKDLEYPPLCVGTTGSGGGGCAVKVLFCSVDHGFSVAWLVGAFQQ